MMSLWMPSVTHTEVWTIIALCMLLTLAVKACRIQMPSVVSIQNFATICNTKGGIILILLTLWLVTLFATVIFSVWVIVRGVDPQHATVVTLIGMLTGTAFGNVNGALFKTMTGEDPKPPVVASSVTTATLSQAPAVPPTAV